MKEALLPLLHHMVGSLPGCTDPGASGLRIVGIVFLLNLLIFGISFAKGRPLFLRPRRQVSGIEWGILGLFAVTTLMQIALVVIVYRLSLRYTQLPLYFEDTMYGGTLGIFRDMEGIETPAPSFGKVCGLDLVQIIFADEKEWIYLGFLVNILLTYINFFFAVVYYGYHLVRRISLKRKEKHI